MKNKNINIVSLHGSYFTNNYGDVLLVNLFYNWIREAFPSVIVNLPLVDKKRIKEMPEPSTSDILNLIKSDCLVYCGGGYFGEQPGSKLKWSLRNFYRHGIVGIIAIVFHIPIAIIGVEIGPISSSWFRHIVLWIVKKSKVVVVRNQESFEYLQKYGVNSAILAADAVLSLNQSFPKDVNNQVVVDKCKIVLHLPGYTKYREELESFVNALCNCLISINSRFQLVFVEDIPHQYSNNYNKLFQIIGQNGLEYTVMKYVGMKQLMEVVKESYAVFTTKLHVGITAAAFNKRVFSMYMHPKTLRFHHQIENDAYCMPISKLLDYDNLDEKLTDFLNSKDKALPSSVLTLAMKCKTELESFIHSCLS